MPGLMYIGDRVLVTAHNADSWHVYGVGRVRFGNLNPSDHPQWAGLQSRRWELEGGGGVVGRTPIGMLTFRVSSDVIKRSRGQEALLSFDIPLLRERFALMPSVALVWRSHNLANYYFGGVSAAEASTLHPAYDVGATLSFSSGMVGTYRFARHWMAVAFASYEHFPGAVEHSPLVGTSGEVFALLGAGYVY